MRIIGLFALLAHSTQSSTKSRCETATLHKQGKEQTVNFGELLSRYRGQTESTNEAKPAVQEEPEIETPRHEQEKEGVPEMGWLTLGTQIAALQTPIPVIEEDAEELRISGVVELDLIETKISFEARQDISVPPTDNDSIDLVSFAKSEGEIVPTEIPLEQSVKVEENTQDQVRNGKTTDPIEPKLQETVQTKDSIFIHHSLANDVSEADLFTSKTEQFTLLAENLPNQHTSFEGFTQQDPRLKVSKELKLTVRSEAENLPVTDQTDTTQKVAHTETSDLVFQESTLPEIQTELLVAEQSTDFENLLAEVEPTATPRVTSEKLTEVPLESLEEMALGDQAGFFTKAHTSAPIHKNETLATNNEETEIELRSIRKEPVREGSPRPTNQTTVIAEAKTFEAIAESVEKDVPVRSVMDLADRENLISKLVQSMETLVHEERTEVRILLKPDHLGELKIKLSTERGIMMAEFIVQNETVREVIASQLPQLHTALQEQGTKMADVMVNIGFGQQGQEDEGKQQPQKFTRNYQGRPQMQKTVGLDSEKAYLGRTIWNQVDVRV